MNPLLWLALTVWVLLLAAWVYCYGKANYYRGRLDEHDHLMASLRQWMKEDGQ